MTVMVNKIFKANGLAFFILLSCLISVLIFSGTVMADNGVGLDFSALLDESIKAKGSVQDGLIMVTGKSSCETLPENHDEMVRCVDSKSQWDPAYAGFSTTDKILQTENPHGKNEYYTMRISGYFYVSQENAGNWDFSIHATDAAQIDIDGQPVASLYGKHEGDRHYRSGYGSIELKQGWHYVVSRYVKSTGYNYTHARFRLPGTSSWEDFSTESLTLAHYPYEEGILLVNKKNLYDKHPLNHEELKNCVQDASESHVDYFGWRVVDEIHQTENLHGIDTAYTSYYETYFEVTEDTAGDWQFAVDSGSASEIVINGIVVAERYGEHNTTSNDKSNNGSIALEKGWHKLVCRQETLDGTPAAMGYFKKPGDTDWHGVSTSQLRLKTYAADLDLDGIHNDLEAILGTDMENLDTDFEGLNDYTEVARGSDPLQPDTNNDGLPDIAELADSNLDPDEDGIENVLDTDNDGDGVTDGIDLSPFARTTPKSEFHFEIQTNGNSTYLDFQVRTANPINLMLFGKQYDWPYDTEGQMQDRDNSKEDVQLIPMLELTANVLPNQDLVEDSGINVTTDGKVGSFDAGFTHNDGMGVGNVTGDSGKELVTAGDVGHIILINDAVGNNVKEFDSVFSKGDKIIVADVFNDDYAEILVFHDADNHVYVYDGEGHLLTKQTAEYVSSNELAAANVMGDDKAEVVTVTRGSKNIGVWGFINHSSSSPPEWFKHNGFPLDWTYSENDGLGLSDVDGNGYAEMLVANGVDDKLSIITYEYGQKTVIDNFEFDAHDALMGADVLVSQDTSNPRYGDEILVVKPDGHVRVYTEAGSNEEDRIEDTGYTEFDGYITADLSGDDKREIVITSDTTGVVNIYNTRDKKAYVPLAPVKENGTTVAFQGRMIYTATGEPINLVADARLVWFVVGKTDTEEEPGANKTTVLAKYQDDFLLTGFSATEYKGVTAGIFHKDNRDQVSNAYMLMQYNFLYGADTLNTIHDAFEDETIEVDQIVQDFDHEYEAEKWISKTLEDDIIPGLADGILPIAFGMETLTSSLDLSLFVDKGTLAQDDSFTADLINTKTQTSRTIKMNWYDTTMDTVSPMGLSDIHDAFTSWGYTTQKVNMAMANIAIASEGEQSAGEHYSAMKRNGLGITFKVGNLGGNLFMSAISTNQLVTATRFKFQAQNMIKGTGLGYKLKWMKSYKMAKQGGMFAKFGKHAAKLSKFAKIGGAVTATAFAAYTFYSVASASGWSTAGILAGAAYAGMQGTYFMALALISYAVPGGPVIAGLLVISDIITWAITGEGWSEKIMQWVAAKLTEVTKPPNVDIKFDDPSVLVVDYEGNGFDVGDRIEFKCRATETITKKNNTRTSDMEDSYVKPYTSFQDSNNYHKGDYRFTISNQIYDNNKRIRKWDVGAWVEPKAADIDFQANVTVEARMKIYYRVCTGDECDRKSKTKKYSYGDTKLVFDVMPGSLDDFINWSVLTPLDRDNDTLANSDEGQDKTWRAMISKSRSDQENKDMRLTCNGSNVALKDETGEEDTHFEFKVENTDDGPYFKVFSRQPLNRHEYLQVVSDVYPTVYFDTDKNDYGLWDIVPVKDDLYRIINKGYTQEKEKAYCFVPQRPDRNSPSVVPCPETGTDSLWRIETKATSTHPNRTDSDGDGLNDKFESDLLLKGMSLNPTVADADHDGLTDKEEMVAGTNSSVKDSDGDGISDKDELTGWDVRLTYNTITLTKKVTSNPLDEDSDKDGLSDFDEKNGAHPLNPMAQDTDGDGVPDNIDDDPLNAPDGPDTDYDKLPDAIESEGWTLTVTTGSGVVTKTVTSRTDKIDTDDDGLTDKEEYKTSDPANPDTDGDGITDKDEKTRGTDLAHYDTDRDGLTDGNEINTHSTDPLVMDTDDDGLSDSTEVNETHTSPVVKDTDGDGLDDGTEKESSHTDPLKKDTDSDEISDGDEVLTHKTNPLAADTDGDKLSDKNEIQTYCSSPLKADSDKDGLTDYDEIAVYGTSPCDRDHDNDGLWDGDEIGLGTDPLNEDSDGDFILDGTEVRRYHTNPLSNDTDGDGLNDTVELGLFPNLSGVGTGTEPTEADTDNDGIIDSMDPDTSPIQIEHVLMLYHDISNSEMKANFMARLQPLIDDLENVVTVQSGTPEDFDDISGFPFVLMVGKPSDQGDDGSVPDMIFQLTDEETRTNLLEDPYLRFAVSAVGKYTGLPQNPTITNPSETTPPDPSGPQVDLGLEDSLVVMLADPYDLDAYRVLYKFAKLKKLYLENFAMDVYTANPVTEFNLDGRERADSRVEGTFKDVGANMVAYAAASLVAYTDESCDHPLRSNDLEDGDLMVDRYLLNEVSAYIPDGNFPPEQLDSLVDPLETSTLKIYYTTLDLDRSLPRDNDIMDMGDIDESTLVLYCWNGLTWDKLNPGVDGVTAIVVHPENVEFDLDGDGENDKTYEGYVELISNRAGLYCLAGQQRPDTTPDGAPVVSHVTPGPGAIDIAPTTDVQVTFNEVVEEADLSGILMEGAQISSMALDDKRLTIQTQPLVNGVTYMVILPVNTVVDKAGNLNDTEYSWSFTVLAGLNPPYANDDDLATNENNRLTANVKDDNGSGPDVDDEGDPLTVVAVNGNTGHVDQQVSGSHGGTFVISADGTLVFDPGQAFQALGKGEIQPTGITYTLSDGTNTDNATVEVQVSGVNDRPVISTDTRFFTPIAEDAGDDKLTETTNNTGTTVIDLLGSAGTITDIDNDTFGIAVTGAKNENGTWEYSLDSLAWQAIPTNTAVDAALLLGSSARVRFVPESDYFGDVIDKFMFKAWDMTDKYEGDTGVNTAIGASFSTAAPSTAIHVEPVNDPPVIAVNTGGVFERGNIIRLSPNELKAQDPDDEGTGLVFTLRSSVSGGTLFVDANGNGHAESSEILALGDRFTQDDINHSRLVYGHEGVSVSDHFGFDISDGGEDGALPVTGQEFHFTLNKDTNGSVQDIMPILKRLTQQPDTAQNIWDINGNGKIDLIEAVFLLQAITGQR